MKKSVLILMFVAVAISLVLLSFKTPTPANQVSFQVEDSNFEIPQNVQAILDKSCLPCHGADGSGKAKLKWNYEKMNDYDNAKRISKLVKISENVSEEDMPPPKNLKKNPDRKLSDEERKILSAWADELAEKMSKTSN